MSRINTIANYLKEKYPDLIFVKEVCNTIDNQYAPLQSNYGGSFDCSLTTIAAIIFDLTKRQYKMEEIYAEVEKVAKKRFYKGEVWGTPFVFISNIYNTIAKKYKISAKCKGRYLKDIGFNYEMIKLNIDCGKPVILNVYDDGRKYYEKHTVKIIGYSTVTLLQSSTGQFKTLHMLKVYDNWKVYPGYIDYDEMSTISSINVI